MENKLFFMKSPKSLAQNSNKNMKNTLPVIAEENYKVLKRQLSKAFIFNAN